MSFGRRAAARLAQEAEFVTADTAVLMRATPEQFALLRRAALSRLDPVKVAEMDSGKLRVAIAAAVGEVANEQRVQLNAPEQAALVGEPVSYTHLTLPTNREV